MQYNKDIVQRSQPLSVRLRLTRAGRWCTVCIVLGSGPARLPRPVVIAPLFFSPLILLIAADSTDGKR